MSERMMRRRLKTECCDCGSKTKWVYPVVQLADGKVLRVCPPCYRDHYRPYFHEPVKRERGQRVER